MQEIIEKIKERLEAEKRIAFLTLANTGDKARDIVYGEVMAYLNTAIDIVNQVAEEYKDSEMLNLVRMNADFQNAKLEELKKIKGNLSENLTSSDVCTIYDILDQFHMFQGRRAGREFWGDKPKAVQDRDIANFNRGLQTIRNYIKENQNKSDRWIPFTLREADDEEKEAYGCDVMLSCKLPEDGEEILVTYRNGYVDTDTFMWDGYQCYLESGCEFITHAKAWMPKPKGYQPKGE